MLRTVPRVAAITFFSMRIVSSGPTLKKSRGSIRSLEPAAALAKATNCGALRACETG